MKAKLIAYRDECLAAKCERCRLSSMEHGWDEWCGECMHRAPEYPRSTAKLGKAAGELYTYLRLNSDEDTTIQDCTAHLGVSVSRAWKLFDQLAKRGLVEQDQDHVWAWDGEKPYMGAVTRD